MAGIVAVLITYYTTINCKPPILLIGSLWRLEKEPDAESPLSPYLGCASMTGEGVYLSILYGIILFNEAGASRGHSVLMMPSYDASNCDHWISQVPSLKENTALADLLSPRDFLLRDASR
jgi:hypothetical protein